MEGQSYAQNDSRFRNNPHGDRAYAKMSAPIDVGASGLGVDLRLLRSWWQGRVNYRWLVTTLALNSALGWVRAVMACGGATVSAVALATVQSPELHGTVERVVAGGVAVAAALWGLRWLLLPWPRATESIGLIAAADVAITSAWCADEDAISRSIGIVVLMTLGLYVAFFHSPKVLAAHGVWSSSSIAAFAVPLFAHGYIYGAVALILVANTVVLVVLPGLQFCYWVLRTEMLSDPLTKLLSRRGLEYHSSTSFRGAERESICAMVIDLDHFKSVNDTFGHPAGDRVLVTTAARLRAAASPRAVVARIGGEEFAILDRLSTATAGTVAERLRCAIAEPAEPVAITASIGVVIADDSGAEEREAYRTVGDLIERADVAMYRAKRLGGNTIVMAKASTQKISAG
ncbi:sensor domain-containing diguanylate cyclase [Nocardia transvalensis]|uniref:GGDEF domain-containing protein n=1 Tax=Nocardia transvalensis TaxID=37333 RepID=UPI001896385C|nr:GGDEF domain-containing protein [Nocardia transvalensis]MBF6331079.1 GGDEF domain-containing protein [Nocardia transvalensis]